MTTMTPVIPSAAREEKRAQAFADAGHIEAHLGGAARIGMPGVYARDIARAIFPELAESDMEGAKRRVRSAAEVSVLIASAPGSHGYALRAAISPEAEVKVWEASLSQARKNFRKAWRGRKAALARMTAPLPPPVGDEETARLLAAEYSEAGDADHPFNVGDRR